jgi:hypothetical protein
MKGTSYFRSLLNSAKEGSATLHPVHKPAWGLTPAPASAEKASSVRGAKPPFEDESPVRTIPRLPHSAAPADISLDSVRQDSPLPSLSVPRVPPAAPDLRFSQLPNLPRDSRTERGGPSRPAAKILVEGPAMAAVHSLQTVQPAEPRFPDRARSGAPLPSSLQPARSPSAPTLPTNKAMAAFIEAATGSEFSPPVPYSHMASTPLRDRQPRSDPRSIDQGKTLATLRPRETLSTPLAFPHAHVPRPPAAPPEELTPRKTPPQQHEATAPPAAQRSLGNSVHIGTVEIHVAPPPVVPRQTAPARVPVPGFPSLARGFQTSVGLRQG